MPSRRSAASRRWRSGPALDRANRGHSVLLKFVDSFSTTTGKGSWTSVFRQDCEVPSHGREAAWNSSLGEKSKLLSVNSPSGRRCRYWPRRWLDIPDKRQVPSLSVLEGYERRTVTAAVFCGARLATHTSEEKSPEATNDGHRRQAKCLRQSLRPDTVRSHTTFWFVVSGRSMGKNPTMPRLNFLCGRRLNDVAAFYTDEAA